MGGGGGRMTPEAGANFAAHRADTAAFDKAVEAATHMPTREVPQAGLNQTNVENSRSIGEQIPWKAANGQAKMHTIDDLNVVTLKDGTTWGYVYHTTDGHLFIQQDQNSRGLGNIGIPIPGTGGSIGWTPAPATHPSPSSNSRSCRRSRTCRRRRSYAARRRSVSSSCPRRRTRTFTTI